jgi:exopolyphosphatase / guanosine-5'-triphosphate,3'-diphosphate pyrophosphatase
MNRCASIDIGTNSTRLLVAAEYLHGAIDPELYEERMTRLGEGLLADGRLAEAAMLRVLDALIEYQRILRQYDLERVRIFATSATRDAINCDELMLRIRRQTGWDCRLLSGEEEARLNFLGVVSDLELDDESLICDVGGGSTEFILTQGKEISRLQSIDIGSSRMTRQFISSDPPSATEVETLCAFVREALTEKAPHGRISAVIATGGTAFTLALMDLQKPITEPLTAHQYLLTELHLQQLLSRLTFSTQNERLDMIGLHPERAAIILAGALIFKEILEYYHQPTMRVSLRDGLFGAILEMELWKE